MTADAARKWLQSSRPALATRIVEESLPAEPPMGPLCVSGVFWIPDRWPATPHCSVRSSLGSSSEPLRMVPSPELIDGVIPVCAEVYVFHQGFERGAATEPYAWREHMVVRQLARDALQGMLAESGKSLQPSELEAWQWNLALQGEPMPGLSAACVDGSRVEATRVADILRSGGRVALSSQPLPFVSAGMPVLLDDGSSACRVLRARARKGIDELSPASTSREQESADEASSWLQRMGSLLTAALSGEKTGPAEPHESQLAGALLRMLHALRLTGNPVRAVGIATRGRPVRFRSGDGTLLINTGDEAVRACLALAPESALAILGAAALAELNRELPAVTDREEANALGNLLRQLASRAGS